MSMLRKLCSTGARCASSKLFAIWFTADLAEALSIFFQRRPSAVHEDRQVLG
jgi:hypothetical protein